MKPKRSPYDRVPRAVDCWADSKPVKPRAPWHGMTPEEAYRQGRADQRRDTLLKDLRSKLE